MTGQCANANTDMERIIAQGFVPLIQGTLKCATDAGT